MKIDLTQKEIVLVRQLITDRVENRFRTAEKAAADMDRKTLRGCVDEIEELEALREKVNGKETD